MRSKGDRTGSIRCLLSLAVVVGLLAGCEYTPTEFKKRDDDIDTDYSKRKTIFGEGGLNFFGDDKKIPDGGALGVNSFLWRASLDTISFMPINSADAFGGVIITDWHSPAESPNERFKLNVYILGRTLRADGVRVSVFRQIKKADGTWQDSSVPDGTGPKIEDSILTKARILRHQTISQN